MLPEELAASASARGWKAPPIDHVGAIVPSVLLSSAVRRGDVELLSQIDAKVRESRCVVDDSVWLAWAKGLPEVPDDHPRPDPKVLERFSLVLQDNGTDATEEPLEAFFEGVWDKVAGQYGRYVEGVGADECIEWIAVKHWDTVVALVLDGLRRYGLMDRYTVIRSEPDPADWQRDRNITVWPQGGAAGPPALADRGRHPGSGEGTVADGGPGLVR
jgi:hypothetical protein